MLNLICYVKVTHTIIANRDVHLLICWIEVYESIQSMKSQEKTEQFSLN